MSRSDQQGRPTRQRAVALQYGVSDSAPVIVASGMGHLAEKILDVAQENGVPIYEDNSLATILSQLNLGQEIPEELYRAVVEIYVYFLNFDFDRQGQGRRGRRAETAPAAPEEPPAPQEQQPPQGSITQPTQEE
ncbi:EscU/YscU/HrcU family type III secretion system export apparatus switch protein [Acutalibacter caecimuris]|uniref:EscU/YscU/HrcU family type III secretion system export apparatus switch protein n=1 Tax=Acutalibacter caecimuris TaxID=3093657 RepID=UPI002AC93511|nr:EscU/YscU/HrcU family type III secretion system export apparatus switch protein [Acutalibacter sp. M00118]